MSQYQRHEEAVNEALNRTAWQDDPLIVAASVLPTTADARRALDALHKAGWRIVRIADEWEPES
jgi:hypothetical protein